MAADPSAPLQQVALLTLRHPTSLPAAWVQQRSSKQAATLSWLLLLQGGAAEVQKVQEAVALDPTRLSAALLGLLAVPVVAWSEYTLKTTGQRLNYFVVLVLAPYFDPCNIFG